MGNCLKAPAADDISLLRGNDSQDGSDSAVIGPPPPYQVHRLFIVLCASKCTLLLYFS